MELRRHPADLARRHDHAGIRQDASVFAVSGPGRQVGIRGTRVSNGMRVPVADPDKSRSSEDFAACGFNLIRLALARTATSTRRCSPGSTTRRCGRRSRGPARRQGRRTSHRTGLRRRRGSLHYKHTGSMAEVAELLGDSKRVAASHYVYALTDYREVDRQIALARAEA